MKTNPFLVRVCMICALFIVTKFTTANAQSVNVEESNKTYHFTATYDKAKTDKVLDYMDQSLKHASDFSFKHTQIDATITLTGGMNFYMHNEPGTLEFKFDKKKNSSDDYKTFTKMCDGLKKIIQDN
jgi:hypothetical protein